jgi:hypothetical protein
MARVHISMLLCVALLASAASAAMGAPVQRTASTIVSGVYSVIFNLDIASTLPAGTTITCRARIMPNSGPLDLGNPQLSATSVETAAGMATVTGSTATCAAEIPFAWTVESARGGVVLSYEIDAVSNSGAAPQLVRSSGRQGIGAALPAAGQTARLTFYVAF